MNKRNPWEYESFGHTVQTCDVVSRLSKLKGMTASELRDVMAWPGTQKTVRAAARRALDKIAAQNSALRTPRSAFSTGGSHA